MKRVEIPHAIETEIEVEAKKVIAAVSGASVSVTDRDTSSSATVYAAETGETTIASLKTDEHGKIKGWLPEGSYKLSVSGGTPAISPFEFSWDAVRGDGVENIGKEVIKAENIASEAVTAGKLALEAVETTKIKASAVTEAKLGSESVSEAKIKKEAVTGAKLGEGTVRQGTGTTQSVLSWGIVSSIGVIEGGTGDFTVKKEGTGVYAVEWNAPIDESYSLSVTVIDGQGWALAINGIEFNTGFKVQTTPITKLNELANKAFTFQVLRH